MWGGIKSCSRWDQWRSEEQDESLICSLHVRNLPAANNKVTNMFKIQPELQHNHTEKTVKSKHTVQRAAVKQHNAINASLGWKSWDLFAKVRFYEAEMSALVDTTGLCGYEAFASWSLLCPVLVSILLFSCSPACISQSDRVLRSRLVTWSLFPSLLQFVCKLFLNKYEVFTSCFSWQEVPSSRCHMMNS